MIETLRHQKAFEYYYGLGNKRSLAEVGRKFGVSEVSTQKWGSNFGWQERVKERDDKNALALAKKNDAQLIRNKAKDLKLVEEAKVVWAQWLKGNIECPNCHQSIAISKLKPQFRDVDTLIRLSEFLSGEADSRPEQIIRLEYVDPKPRSKNEESTNYSKNR